MKCLFLPALAVAIVAVILFTLQAGPEDTAVAVVRFKNGGLGHIVVSNSQNPALYGKVLVHGDNGATIGELDEKALYYLRSRGVPLELARKILIFAFANDVVLAVEVPAVRRHVESILLASHGLPNL